MATRSYGSQATYPGRKKNSRRLSIPSLDDFVDEVIMPSENQFASLNLTKMCPGIPSGKLDDFLRDEFQGRKTYLFLDETERKMLSILD